MREPTRQVLEAARRKDERAFEAVVSACGGFVLNLAYRMVRDRTEAEVRMRRIDADLAEANAKLEAVLKIERNIGPTGK